MATFTSSGEPITSASPQYDLPIICNNGVVKVSPNLFDKNNPTYCAGYISTNSNGIIENSTATDTFYIKCQPNTTYTLQRDKIKTQNQVLRLATFSKTPQVGVHCNQITGGLTDDLIISITTGNDDVYVGFSIGRVKAGETTYLNGVQLEQGTTATAYMPYKQVYIDGTTETVKDSLNNIATAENLLSVGTYKDFQEVLTGALTKNIDTIVLAGNESELNYYGVYSGHNLFYYEINATQVLKAETNAPLCTHYTPYSGDPKIMPNNCIRYQFLSSNMNYNRIYFTDDRFSTLSDWKAFIAQQYTKGTPIIIATIRLTATTSTVTAQTLITKKGTNTIEITQASIDNLEIEANYKAGVITTITEIQNDQLDNSVTVTIGE